MPSSIFAVTGTAAGFSRTSVTSCGSAALPRMIVSVTLVPDFPRRTRVPSKTDMSRVGLPSIARIVSAVRKPAFCAGDPSRAAMMYR